MTIHFDKGALALRIRAKRGKRPLREVAHEIGDISVSTLSRIERGHPADMNTFVRLCAWLEASPQAFFCDAPETQESEMSVLLRIELSLRADTALTTDFIDALLHVIRLFHSRSEKRSERSASD